MIKSLDQVTEFPLCWPEEKPRTSRRESSKSKAVKRWGASLAYAHQKIEDEMRRMAVRGFVVSMAPRHRFGSPDPGVAVWWNDKPKIAGERPVLRVLACDRFDTAETNLYAIGLSLDRLRALERYGAYSIEQAIEGARAALPAPEHPQARKWWEVLGVASNWPLEAIELKYQNLAKKAHPDNGGSTDEMAELNAAIEKAREAVAG